jgi:hypothetical protein
MRKHLQIGPPFAVWGFLKEIISRGRRVLRTFDLKKKKALTIGLQNGPSNIFGKITSSRTISIT